MASLKSREEEGVLIVSFADAKILEDSRIQQIGQELLAAAEQAAKTEPGRLVLNFDGVTFMSSAMIGKLVLLNKQCAKQNVALKMCHISKNVAEVFKITRLNKVFDIQADEEKALKSFDKKGWFGLG
ncbi:MAG: STAS domain-containing protein [Pirellulaceae bacterium]|nr:STAS domain-containing protein [Pirellulaceae bacterium]